MNLTATTTTTAAAATATMTRSGDSDTETPPKAQQPTGFLAYANGPLKRHYPTAPRREIAAVVSYKECLRNHAATMGGHAIDGCCEFMPSPTATPSDPTSLKCAACGCHRNFHRRDPDDPSPIHHHPIRHQAPHPQQPPSQPRQTSDSPPPPQATTSSSPYYSSAPQMLLALSQNQSGPSNIDHNHNHYHHHNFASGAVTSMSNNPHGKKRFRTKFSQEQKARMLELSEKLGWKMQKSDESLIEEFCNEVGVGKGVLKVWMHNNKHAYGKRENHNTPIKIDSNGDAISMDINNNHDNHGSGNGLFSNGHKEINAGNEANFDNVHVSTNGSSSSS